MCGIAGYLCTAKKFDRRFNVALPILSIEMEKRGNHSWGFTNGTQVWKTKGSVNDAFDGTLLGFRTALLHTRFATVGAHTAENSHPFMIGNILGVHNGQVFNHKSIAEKYGIDYQVDSEIIFHQLVNGRDLSELEGYGAIVFFQEGKLHIGRFVGGSLEMAYTDSGWMWASTKHALDMALRMSGFTVGEQAVESIKLEVGKLYRIEGDNIVVDDRPLNMTERVVVRASYTPTKTWNIEKRCWEDVKGNTTTGYSNGGGMGFGTRGGWSDTDDAGWNSNRSGFVDNRSTQGRLPLPTAETTTFTSEPSSDHDDAIDSTDVGTKCTACNGPLSGTAFIQIQGSILCMDCYDLYARDRSLGADQLDAISALYGMSREEYINSQDVQRAGDTDLPDDVFDFREMTADEAEAKYHTWKVMKCDDCNDWSVGREKVYIDDTHESSDDPEVGEAILPLSVCAQCYKKNYGDVEDAELAEHPTEQQIEEYILSGLPTS